MLNRMKVANAALYVLAIAILCATALATFLFIAPETVLKDWRVVAPTGNYHVGETIVVQSLFTKLKDVDGVSHRSLLCTDPQGATVAYMINDAIANHQAQSKAGVGVPVTIPLVVTPTKCKLAISIEYKIYPFRTITEYATSNSFNVVK